jgi:hypothetical protein
MDGGTASQLIRGVGRLIGGCVKTAWQLLLVFVLAAPVGAQDSAVLLGLMRSPVVAPGEKLWLPENVAYRSVLVAVLAGHAHLRELPELVVIKGDEPHRVVVVKDQCGNQVRERIAVQPLSAVLAPLARRTDAEDCYCTWNVWLTPFFADLDEVWIKRWNAGACGSGHWESYGPEIDTVRLRPGTASASWTDPWGPSAKQEELRGRYGVAAAGRVAVSPDGSLAVLQDSTTLSLRAVQGQRLGPAVSSVMLLYEAHETEEVIAVSWASGSDARSWNGLFGSATHTPASGP